jgi:hypothetical protein
MRVRRTPAPRTTRPRATRLRRALAALLAAPLALGTLAATALPATAAADQAFIDYAGPVVAGAPVTVTFTCESPDGLQGNLNYISAGPEGAAGPSAARTGTSDGDGMTYSAVEQLTFPTAGAWTLSVFCHPFASGTTSVTVDVLPPAPVVADTTTTLTLGQSRVEPGQPLSAGTVTTTTDGTATEGSVQFYLDGQPSGAPVPVDSSGRADTVFPALVAGERSVTATYLGAGLFKASTSDAQVAFAKAKATITPSIPSSTQAPSTTLRASVVTAPGFPAATGTITFRYSEGALLGEAPIVNGLATLDLPGLGAGTYDVFAVYSGDDLYGDASTSRTNMTVAPAVPQVPHTSPTEVTVDVPAKITGTRVEVKVSVAPGMQWTAMSSIQAAHLSGSVAVTLTKGGERQKATLVEGSATVVFDGVAPGTYEVEAVYGGDTYYDSSVGRATTTVSAVVVPPTVPPVTPPAPDLSGSTSTLPAGGTITLVARDFLPGETVSFFLHSDPIFLGTAVADANGVATLVVAIPADAPAGAHHVRATGQTSQRTAEIPVTVTAAAPPVTTPVVTEPVVTAPIVTVPVAAAPVAETPVAAPVAAAPVAAPLAATGAEIGSTALLVSVLLGAGALLVVGRRRFSTSS